MTFFYKRFFISILFVGCALALNATPDARREAEQVLYKMHQAIESLEKNIPAPNEARDQKEWVLVRLETMAAIDQLIRRVLVENVMSNAWPLEVQRAFVEYFFQPTDTITDSKQMGFAQLNDLYQYNLLKQLIRDHPLLQAYGWPVIKEFGPDADYHAFLIAQHGQSFDTKWQQEHLIPHLNRLAAQGQTSSITHLWLSYPEPEYMDEMARLMEMEGGPWAEMIPEIARIQRFFLHMPKIMKAPRSQRLAPKA